MSTCEWCGQELDEGESVCGEACGDALLSEWRMAADATMADAWAQQIEIERADTERPEAIR